MADFTFVIFPGLSHRRRREEGGEKTHRRSDDSINNKNFC